jgi:hypothetical protein
MRLTAVLVALLTSAAFGGVSRAETAGAQPAAPSYRDAQYVQITLGAANQEAGIRKVEAPAEPGEHFFYFDVNDTYINGGVNKVIMTVQYLDVGLTPIYLDYDALDPLRPEARVDPVVKKRVLLAQRSNSEALKSAYITLEDARFADTQAGGADFRIGGTDEPSLTNVSVMRVEHREPQPPIQILLDGRKLSFDPNEVQPFVHPQTGRTLVPFRAIFNALGVKNDEIKWYNETRTVEARRGQTTIRLAIDSDIAVVNFRPVKLDQPPTIVADRTVVPLRFVAEQFGLQVTWDEKARTIQLITQQPTKP